LYIAREPNWRGIKEAMNYVCTFEKLERGGLSLGNVA